jgi:hypothetical protein
MSNRIFSLILAALFCLVPLTTWKARAGVPLPFITFYGMLVDEFGWPYQANVNVELSANGVKIYSKSITLAQGQDYNFLFRAPYDSGGAGGTYTTDAIAPGDKLTVKIVTTDTQTVLINTNIVAAFPPGSVVNVNLSAGTDSVGDGLPDELRKWIYYNLGLDGPFDPTKIKANDDSDGDGVSNINEYRAGTDPANADDVLQLFIDNSDRPNVRQLTFYTVPGKAYKIQSSMITSGTTTWSPVLFASSPGGAATNTQVIGTGHYLSVFIPASDSLSFYRISVSSKSGSSIVP